MSEQEVDVDAVFSSSGLWFADLEVAGRREKTIKVAGREKTTLHEKLQKCEFENFFGIFFSCVGFLAFSYNFEHKFKELFNFYGEWQTADLNEQFNGRVATILDEFKEEMQKDIFCELLRKVEEIVKLEITLSEEQAFVQREEHLKKIVSEIKKKEKEIKRNLGLKKYNILQEVKNELLSELTTGEEFARIKHDIKRVIIRDLYFDRDEVEKIRIEMRTEIKNEIKKELMADVELIKKDLKQELLDDIERSRPVCLY